MAMDTTRDGAAAATGASGPGGGEDAAVRRLADGEKRAIKVALSLALLRDASAASDAVVGASENVERPSSRGAISAALATRREELLEAEAGTSPDCGDALMPELEVLGQTRLEARPELMGRFLRASGRAAKELPVSAPRVSELARTVGRRIEAAPGSFASERARSFLQLLGSVHDAALASAVLHGLDGVLGDAAVELLEAPDLEARAVCHARCEPLLLLFRIVLVRALPSLSREDRAAVAEMLGFLVADFEHAPLPHAFLVELFHGLPALRDARPAAAPAAAASKKKRARARAK